MEPRQRGDTSEAQLKRLLFAEELALLERIRARTEALDDRLGDDEKLTRSIREILEESLSETDDPDWERLARALAPLVVRAIREETERGQEATIAALRPVAGRLLAAALAQAVLAPLRALDRLLHRSLSPRLWRARVEALVTGTTVGEALARRHPELRFEHFLLVHRPSGRPLMSSTDGPIEDDEQLTGMLSLVTTFGRDVVDARGGPTVRSVRFGQGDLLLRNSERLTLAVLANGPRPPDLHDAIDALFVDLVGRREATLAEADGTLFPARRRALGEAVRRRLTAIAAAAQPAREPRVPARALLLVATIAIAGGGLAAHDIAPLLERRDIERRALAAIAADPALSGYPIAVTWDDRRETLGISGLVPTAGAVTELETRIAEALPDGTAVLFRVAALPTPEARDAELLVGEVETRLRSLLAQGNRQIADLAFGLYDAERELARLDLDVATALDTADRAERAAAATGERADRAVADAERRLAADIVPMRADMDRIGDALRSQEAALETRAAILASAIEAEATARSVSEESSLDARREMEAGVATLGTGVASLDARLDASERQLAETAASLAAGLESETALRADLDARVDAVASAVDARRVAQDESAAATSAAIDAMIERVAALAEQTTDLAGQAATLEAAIAALEGRLGTSADRDALAALGQRLDGAERDAAISGEVQALAERVAAAGTAGGGAAEARVEALEHSAITAFGALDRRLEALAREAEQAEDKTVRLERSINDLRTVLDARLAAMESEIGASLDALQSRLSRSTIYFDEGEAFADPDAADAALRDIAMQILRADPSIGLRIVGYADHARGTVETNRLASQQRADFVMSTLATLGVPEERMSAIGRSTERLISPVKGRGSPNRRAEFEAIYLDGPARD